MSTRLKSIFLGFAVIAAAHCWRERASAQQGGQFLQSDPQENNRFVSRKDFAESLMRKLGFEAPGAEHSQDAIQFLSGDKSIDIQPANYTYAAPNIRQGSTLVSGKPKPYVYAQSAAAPVTYEFSTRRAGETLISAKITGGSQIWSIDGQAPMPVRAAPGGEPAESVPVKLRPGVHQLRVTLPPGGTLADIRVDAPCVAPILPEFQGPTNQPVTYGEKTVSMVRALGLTGNLPNQGNEPVDYPAITSLTNPGASRPVSTTNEKGQALSGVAVNRSGPGSESGRLQFEIDVKKAGIYQVTAQVSGSGKAAWYTNGCRADSSSVRAPDNNPQTITIGTMHLNRGVNRITFQGGPNLKVFGFRLQQKKQDSGSYYEVAKAAGLQEGNPNALVDEAGLNSNIKNVLTSLAADKFQLTAVEEMSDDRTGLPLVQNDAPGLGDFQMDDDALFDVPVSPFLPTGGLP